jgi:hypothetical protein
MAINPQYNLKIGLNIELIEPNPKAIGAGSA